MTIREFPVGALRPLASLIMVLLLVTACASAFDPVPADQLKFLDRAQTQERDGIRVTTAVPSADETRALFGTSLYSRRVQPVWLEIDNNANQPVAFLPVGLDANFFTPIEAATIYERKKTREEVERYFFQSGVDTVIGPGETRSGYIFTNLDEGTKAFNVDIVGGENAWAFTFFVQVPGLRIDHHDVDFATIYSDEEVSDFHDQSELIEALQQLPCCTTDKNAVGTGDPLNLVVIGEPTELYYAFIRAGWDETETITTASSFKTALSFVTGGEYRYSPVSSLYVFDRPQDAAFQKIRENIHERNHLRVWMAPYRYKGEEVWVGQISRDIGVRFTTKTITTHKIDPDVDETREFLLENLAYNQALARFAYVSGAVAAPIDEPRRNLTGDPYFTDGLRVVLWVSSDSIGFDEIEVEHWEMPED